MIHQPWQSMSNRPQTIPEQVQSVLKTLGLPADKMQDFTRHASTLVELSPKAPIRITLQDDRLFLSCRLEWPMDQLLKHSDVVLPVITEAIAGLETGQLALVHGAEAYELKALLSLSHVIQDGALATLLEVLTQRVNAIRCAVEAR